MTTPQPAISFRSRHNLRFDGAPEGAVEREAQRLARHLQAMGCHVVDVSLSRSSASTYLEVVTPDDADDALDEDGDCMGDISFDVRVSDHPKGSGVPRDYDIRPGGWLDVVEDVAARYELPLPSAAKAARTRRANREARLAEEMRNRIV